MSRREADSGEDGEASPACSELPVCRPLTAAEVKDVSPEARNDSAHIFGLETVSSQDGDVFSHKTIPTGGRCYTTTSVAVLYIRSGLALNRVRLCSLAGGGLFFIR